LERQDISVISNLNQPDIDLILVTSVKPWARGAAFDIVAALHYVSAHPATKIVLRVNECDERKGNRLPLLNNLLRASAGAVNHTVFVSKWLQDTLLSPGSPVRSQASVIHSGADPIIFNPAGRAVWDGQEPLQIVTHHWSSSWYKGWDVYQTLNDFLGTSQGKGYQFTFIGNPWPKARLQHTHVIPATSGRELAALLKQYHLYISASQNEPAGMHYIEALQCGLPVLFRRSGSLPEYCQSHGISFATVADMPTALKRMKCEYQRLTASLDKPSYTAQDMCEAYGTLFRTLLHASPRSSMPHSTASLRLQQSVLWLRDSLV
jgi:glycosyltransferase involved in cell wall biosynthesis